MRIFEQGTYRNLEYRLYVEHSNHILEVTNRQNGVREVVTLSSRMNLPFIKEMHFDIVRKEYTFVIADARGIGNNLKIVISE